MKDEVRDYLAKIGQRGGRKSRRKLSSQDAKNMVRVRQGKSAFKKFHSMCFWSYKPNLKISAADLPWLIEQLMRNGNREAWQVGAKLCL